MADGWHLPTWPKTGHQHRCGFSIYVRIRSLFTEGTKTNHFALIQLFAPVLYRVVIAYQVIFRASNCIGLSKVLPATTTLATPELAFGQLHIGRRTSRLPAGRHSAHTRYLQARAGGLLAQRRRQGTRSIKHNDHSIIEQCSSPDQRHPLQLCCRVRGSSPGFSTSTEFRNHTSEPPVMPGRRCICEERAPVDDVAAPTQWQGSPSSIYVFASSAGTHPVPAALYCVACKANASS